MNVVGIFNEEREPDERGDPGELVSRTLSGFSGPAARQLMAMVNQSQDWRVEIDSIASPLEWDEGAEPHLQ